MKFAELLIKVKSLAAEQTIIRRDENKYVRSFRWAEAVLQARSGLRLSHRKKRILSRSIRRHGCDAGTGRGTPNPPSYIEQRMALDAFDPRIWSATGASSPELEARAKEARRAYGSLAGHRLELKEESRSALLALAFLRGRAYGTVERRSRTEPSWDRIRRIASKFGGPEIEQTWSGWLEEARTYWAAHRA